MKRFTKSLLFLPVLLCCLEAVSQSDSVSPRKMEEVVVTGQYKPQSLQKSVYQVRVITSEKIQLSGAANIQQVLSTQLGFRFSNDNTLGITDVKLNGMGGNNVKILLDGIPMVDRYDERVSLSQIDINNVERIEIVEGPMSVSYGSDAMAGVINIITKKNKKDTFSVNAGAQEETAGNEYFPFSYKGVHIQHVNVNYAKKHLLAAVGGTHNDFDGFGGDVYGRGKTWKPKEQWMGNAKLGYVDDRLHIYYRIDGLNENIRVRNPINMSNYKAIDQEYITDRYIHQVQSELRFNDKIQWSTFVAYTDYRRQTKTTRHNFETNTIEPNQAGEDDISKLNSIAFKTSLQYQLSPKVSLQPGIDINHEKASGARIQGAPEINDYALFVSAEIQPTDFVKIRPGVRISTNSQYDAPPAIPSINAKFRLNKKLDLRLAYGYGFRAPTLRELYLTFFDANHSLIGNKDLKAEYSNSVNGSLTFKPQGLKKATFSSTLSGFYSAYRNQVELIQSRTDNTQYTYYNTDRSKTTGGSWENYISWKKLELTIGASYIAYSSSQFDDKNYVKEDNRDLLWTPEVYSDITYRADKIKTTFALFYKYVGRKPAFSFGTLNSQNAILLTRTDAYNLADFTASTDITKFLSTRIGVKNIFDVTDVKSNTVSSSNSAHSSSGPMAIGYGRSFFIGLIFNWSRK